MAFDPDNERNWMQAAALSLRLALADDECKLSPDAEEVIKELIAQSPETLYDDMAEDLQPLLRTVQFIEQMDILRRVFDQS